MSTDFGTQKKKKIFYFHQNIFYTILCHDSQYTSLIFSKISNFDDFHKKSYNKDSSFLYIIRLYYIKKKIYFTTHYRQLTNINHIYPTY